MLNSAAVKTDHAGQPLVTVRRAAVQRFNIFRLHEQINAVPRRRQQIRAGVYALQIKLDILTQPVRLKLPRPALIVPPQQGGPWQFQSNWLGDRKSTRLNSSQVAIPYAVVCLNIKRTD